ncbi:MAG TPA: hypothetical protein VE685_02045 [Thermoanaerobaculia bacterium]|nr:hypothetical protein [Thermoanaerobaculia bacterium]
MKSTVRLLAFAVTALWLALPQAAAACATCYGDPNDAMTKGMNNGILVLLGFVGLVWAGVGRLIWDFRKRSKKLAEKASVRPRLRLIHGEKR